MCQDLKAVEENYIAFFFCESSLNKVDVRNTKCTSHRERGSSPCPRMCGTAVGACPPVLQPSRRFPPGARGNSWNAAAAAPAGSPTLPPEAGQRLAGNTLAGSISSLHFSIRQALLCHLLAALVACTRGHCLTCPASVF